MEVKKFSSITVDIVSGFLGSGKTTFLKKYLPLIKGKTAVLENEFGDVSIDGDLLCEDIPVREVFSGCICCSIRGEFKKGIKEIIDTYNPDHIVIEPSGISKVSEVIRTLIELKDILNLSMGKVITLIESTDFFSYLDDFGEFYKDQICYADYIFISKLDELKKELEECEETFDFRVSAILKEITVINSTENIYFKDIRTLKEEDLMDIFGSVDSISVKAESTLKNDRSELLNPYGNRKEVLFKSMVIKDITFNTLQDAKNTLENIKENISFGRILRIKGFIEVKESGGTYLVNETPSVSDISKVSSISSVKNKVIVIIGDDLRGKEIKEYFNKKLKTFPRAMKNIKNAVNNKSGLRVSGAYRKKKED